MSYHEIALFLQSVIGTEKKPQVGIICGSGLSGLSKCLTDTITVKYEDIPGFPKATVPGHTGELVFGYLNGVYSVAMRGRFHFYEGNSMEKVVLPVRVMRCIGVKLLIVTNAAGGLNPTYNVGDIMVIQDHFGMPAIAGNHPLRGENDEDIGPRFPSVSDAYDEHLQNLVVKACEKLNLSKYLHTNGTYCYVSGPAYESRAESKFLRMIGGDSVGMSTVPEVIAAKHSGMKILGLSLITNKVVFEKTETQHANHAEVLQAVENSGKNVEAIVREVVNADLAEYLKVVPTYNLKAPERSVSDKARNFSLAAVALFFAGALVLQSSK